MTIQDNLFKSAQFGQPSAIFSINNSIPLTLTECFLSSHQGACINAGRCLLNASSCTFIGGFNAIRQAGPGAECHLNDCYISEIKNVAIYLESDAEKVQLTSCDIVDCGDTALKVEGGVKTVDIKSCLFNNNCLGKAYRKQVSMKSVTFNISHSKFENGDGLWVRNCTNSILERCTFNNNIREGIQIDGKSNLTVKDCLFEKKREGCHFATIS